MTNLIETGPYRHHTVLDDRSSPYERQMANERALFEIKSLTPDQCWNCGSVSKDARYVPDSFRALSTLEVTVKCGLVRCPKETLFVENNLTWPLRGVSAIQGASVTGVWVDEYMNDIDIVPNPKSDKTHVDEGNLEVIAPDPSPEHYGSW